MRTRILEKIFGSFLFIIYQHCIFWELIFNVKCFNLLVSFFGYWSCFLVRGDASDDNCLMAKGATIVGTLSNNLPALGQIHKPSLVLNFWVLFYLVLCFEQREYWCEVVAQCSCMLNFSVYTLFVRYLWGSVQFRKNLLWLEFRSWWANCCLRHYDEGALAINVEEAKQNMCLEWLVVHSFFS